MTTFFQPRLIPIWLLALVVLAAMVPMAMQVAVGAGVSAHAAVRHGAAASEALACKEEGAGATMFYNAATGRTGLVCQVNGHWAVVILDEAGREVTSFVKEKMHAFRQVLRYMRNAGYEIVQ
jgi:hypothetical protein